MDSYKLSSSAQAILFLLQQEGDLTSSEIIKQMDFAARTIRYALKNLLSSNLVEKKSLLDDMRYTKYSLSPTGAELTRQYYRYSSSIPISKARQQMSNLSGREHRTVR